MRLGGFSADGSISYLDFDFTDINEEKGVQGITLDMITPYTPKIKYALGAQYRFETDFGTVTPRLDLSHQGSFFSQPINRPTNEVPSFTLLNGRISWKSADRAWEAAISATNLLNKFYYVGLNDYSFTHAFVGTPGRPREWTLSVRRNF